MDNETAAAVVGKYINELATETNRRIMAEAQLEAAQARVRELEAAAAAGGENGRD